MFYFYSLIYKWFHNIVLCVLFLFGSTGTAVWNVYLYWRRRVVCVLFLFESTYSFSSLQQILDSAILCVAKTSAFQDDLKIWNRKDATNRTWDIFKTFFSQSIVAGNQIFVWLQGSISPPHPSPNQTPKQQLFISRHYHWTLYSTS